MGLKKNPNFSQRTAWLAPYCLECIGLGLWQKTTESPWLFFLYFESCENCVALQLHYVQLPSIPSYRNVPIMVKTSLFETAPKVSIMFKKITWVGSLFKSECPILFLVTQQQQCAAIRSLKLRLNVESLPVVKPSLHIVNQCLKLSLCKKQSLTDQPSVRNNASKRQHSDGPVLHSCHSFIQNNWVSHGVVSLHLDIFSCGNRPSRFATVEGDAK